MKGMRHIFRSLEHRNYRLFFLGEAISLIGTWMQIIALSWLVYRLTNSPLLLGLVAFSSQLPSLILMTPAGVFVDRWNKHRLLVLTQTLAMVQALAIAALVFSGQIQVWQILLLGMTLGVVNAFDMPARQAFVAEMVDKEHLSNAIALNSSIVNIARLVGPAIAGLIIAMVGEGMCFLLNGLSYLAVIYSLLAMRITRARKTRPPIPFMKELKEGISYTFRSIPIRDVLFILAFMSIFAMPYTILMPIFARDILQGDSRTLGLLMAGSGMGALMGGFFLASRRQVRGLGNILVWGALIFGAGIMLFASSRSFWISFLLMLVTGVGMIILIAGSNTLVQTLVEDNKRGRVMSLYSLAFLGTAPIGSLLAGVMASRIGAPITLFFCGAICLAVGLIYWTRLPQLEQALEI